MAMFKAIVHYLEMKVEVRLKTWQMLQQTLEAMSLGFSNALKELNKEDATLYQRRVKIFKE